MKKMVALLLACVLLLTVWGCSEPQVPTEPTSAPTDPTIPTDPTEPTLYRRELQPLLDERNLPELKSREEMLDILQREVYGYIPAKPADLQFSVQKNVISNYCAGKANINEVTASCTINGLPFSFKFRVVIPKSEEKVPFFVHIGFSASESRFQPTEELVDSGYGVLYFHYEHITSDDNDFSNGLAGVLYPDGQRGDTDAGKVAMWAWAAQRVMDYAETISDKLDMSRSVVCGHSRLGKAALLAGATDERFQFVYSNNSGSTGAALARRKMGEDVKRIMNLFPFWFCKNYKQYVSKEHLMPFDQHYLLASIAPRKVLVGSASEDDNADPISEQLACLAASPAFKNGFVCSGVARVGEEFYEGDIGYHLREGAHYFGREDWQKLIKFVNMHSTGNNIDK